MTYTINHNADFNSIEITFDCKPEAAVRDALKALKFRWHSVKKVWYGYADEATARAAIDGKPVKADKPAKATQPAEKTNKFGVKVGDIFHASWGYDQTNNNFFQVIALVGESSVRVREVAPAIIDSEAVCWAAEDRVVKTNTNGKLLPALDRSLFIKDQEKGDVKRIKESGYNGSPMFKMDSFANAYKCTGDTLKVYESWYA